MKAYTDKTNRIDERKCLFSQINADNKSRKKAARRIGKKQTEQNI